MENKQTKMNNKPNKEIKQQQQQQTKAKPSKQNTICGKGKEYLFIIKYYIFSAVTFLSSK